MYNFEPYNVLLTISTNIPMLLMTVLQGHIYSHKVYFCYSYSALYRLCVVKWNKLTDSDLQPYLLNYHLHQDRWLNTNHEGYNNNKH